MSAVIVRGPGEVAVETREDELPQAL